MATSSSFVVVCKGRAGNRRPVRPVGKVVPLFARSGEEKVVAHRPPLGRNVRQPRAPRSPAIFLWKWKATWSRALPARGGCCGADLGLPSARRACRTGAGPAGPASLRLARWVAVGTRMRSRGHPATRSAGQAAEGTPRPLARSQLLRRSTGAAVLRPRLRRGGAVRYSRNGLAPGLSRLRRTVSAGPGRGRGLPGHDARPGSVRRRPASPPGVAPRPRRGCSARGRCR